MILKPKKNKLRTTIVKNPDFYGIPLEFGNTIGKEYLVKEEKVIIQSIYLTTFYSTAFLKTFTINPN